MDRENIGMIQSRNRARLLLEPAQAIVEAQRFTWQALAAGFAAGRGQLVPNRLHQR